jgi:hypothetical protein
MSLDPWAPGSRLPVRIPAHAAALAGGGAAWLTEAFRAAGALAADNAVVGITQFEERVGGATGRKLLLGVAYARPTADLPTELFVKFSRDPDDAVRDSLRRQMDGEVRLALLAREPGFPIAVPKCLYADLDPASGTATLITERIPFGRGGVEPAWPKCADYDLPEPVEHYRALLAAVARLAGAHKAGRLPERLVRDFPFDWTTIELLAPIRFDARQLVNRIKRFGDFAAEFPRLVPARIADPAFLAKAAQEAPRLLAHEAAIKGFLHANPDHIALCHWNANVDNGWFWRGADGRLECGLLDWGGVGQMSLALALYGCLSGAEPEIWDSHLDELLAGFAAEYHAAGGPALDPAELKLRLILMTAMMGLAWLLDAPPIIRAQVPDLAQIESPRDPRFAGNETARMRLHMISMFFNVWRGQDFQATLEAFDQRKARDRQAAE